jgi:hypothetical protein
LGQAKAFGISRQIFGELGQPGQHLLADPPELAWVGLAEDALELDQEVDALLEDLG